MSNIDEFRKMLVLLQRGTVEDWELASQIVDGFPFGSAQAVNRRWILHAIDCGSIGSIRWMIEKGVDLQFTDGEGSTVIHFCIEGERPDRYDVLEMLIAAGANVNAHGLNDWTPLHLAAVLDDRRAMQMLLDAGADRTIRTRIDEYATPEEEARILGHFASADFIANYP